MYSIYKVTNNINGKVYIGLTHRSVKKRWIEHCSRARRHNDDLYFHNAIRKYGEENFTLEIIDSTDDSDELKEKEQYYIKFYDSNNREKGYNTTIGGDGVAQYSTKIIRKYWDEGYATSEIQDLLGGCDKSVISSRLEGYSNYNLHTSLSRGAMKHLSPKERLLKEKEKENQVIQKPYASMTKQVKQYSKDGKYIRTFDSITEAALFMKPNNNKKVTGSCISAVCHGRRKTAYGYKWSFE